MPPGCAYLLRPALCDLDARRRTSLDTVQQAQAGHLERGGGCCLGRAGADDGPGTAPPPSGDFPSFWRMFLLRSERSLTRAGPRRRPPSVPSHPAPAGLSPPCPAPGNLSETPMRVLCAAASTPAPPSLPPITPGEFVRNPKSVLCAHAPIPAPLTRR